MSKPEMHIADFLHQADLLSREIYSHKDYCDDPRLKSPKMVSNPKRAGAFDVFRLLLPHLDTSRLYSLKEERLLKLLMRVYTLSDERTRSEVRAEALGPPLTTTSRAFLFLDAFARLLASRWSWQLRSAC